MTNIGIPNVTGDPQDSFRWQRLDAVKAMSGFYGLRLPSDVTDDGTTLTMIYTPDLSAAETVGLRRIMAVTGLLRITPAEWGAIEDDIVTARTMRTRTNAEWTAMTAAQRDSDLIVWLRSMTDVLRAILRD